MEEVTTRVLMRQGLVMKMASVCVDLSGGLHIPKGVRVVVPNHAIHRESAFYGETANEWDGFRFSAPREAYLEDVAAAGGDPDRLDRVLEQKNQGLIATGADFLSFGHGRHSCPGRFFADASVWLVAANILAVFDILPPIDPVTGKVIMPEFEWIGGMTS